MCITIVGTIVALIYLFWSSTRVRIHKIMKEQRVPGPSLASVARNTLEKWFCDSFINNHHIMSSINHDIVGRLYPHYVTWAAKYGKTFFFSNGVNPKICLTEAELIKELLFNRNACMKQQGTKNFIGNRLGIDFRKQVEAYQTVFYQSKIQVWVGVMVKCTETMLQLVQDQLVGNDQIEISQFVKVLTAHIMSRTEFGSSYEQGIQIAQLLNQTRERRERRAQSSWHSRLYQITDPHYRNELKALEEILREMIQSRVDCVEIGRTNSHGNDLLGRLMNVMHIKIGRIKMQLIVDECKTSLLDGHEDTTLFITWTIMLLACNPCWQDILRAEVNDVCHGNPLTSEHLRKFELLNMVLKESLRLYPPVPIIERMACEDIWIRNSTVSYDLQIPKGLVASIPVLFMNHSPEKWGGDVNDFNPLRFVSNSSVEARRHYFPFSAGPQHCPAQYYVLPEAKIFFAMFLSKFSFTISQNYRHAPILATTRLKPKYGVQINLTRL